MESSGFVTPALEGAAAVRKGCGQASLPNN